MSKSVLNDDNEAGPLDKAITMDFFTSEAKKTPGVKQVRQ